MCGLFGAIGKKNKGGLSIPKIKILGIFNDDRGGDSCGYYYNNTLKKGMGKQKLFKNFIEENVLSEFPAKNNVFIGHTRKASYGATTEENAHPFIVNNRLVLAHNGGISNVWQLCNKYGINHSEIHVDSLALAHLIDKLGFSILDEYVGYAALLMHKIDEPNTMYVYHGASKQYKHDKTLEEERPLFYLQTREGIYFSSLEVPLLYIRDNSEEEPKKLAYNTVFKLVDGEWDLNSVHKVSREENNISAPKKYSCNYSDDYWQGGGAAADAHCHVSPKKPQSIVSHLKDLKNVIQITKGKDDTPFSESGEYSIEKETKPPRCYKDELFQKENPFVYFYRNRYYSSDKNEEMLGMYHIDQQGFIHEKANQYTITWYVYNGVRLHDKEAYDKINQFLDDENSFICNSSTKNFAREISNYSMNPVTNVGLEASEINCVKGLYYYGGSYASKAFQPKFSERSYKFDITGKLKGVHSVINGDIIFNDNEFINHKRIPTLEAKKKTENNKTGTLVYPERVEKLSPFFEKVYDSVDSILALDPEVLNAIQFYFYDRKGIPNSSSLTEDKRAKLFEEIQEFINDAVNEKMSFYDLMEKEFDDYKKYLDLAIMELQCEDLENRLASLKESSITSSIRKIQEAREKADINL